ncbi:OmpA family protein [Lacinutrix sp. 5H-3-7-4]|uniref:OmpA family protein n=1 Tax=Lacinutrix sp. (strain 5H-3-7-4) TaxID=983544 RepID=UPI00020A34CB|nr:OmpA family protein [Lacinutrix sp. 5H-3-7-4]AEH01763.1 OmpA/MotB domain protein [Lacinutrix sp. 5H-3-7-4]
MKPLGRSILILLCIILSHASFSQTKNNPWLVNFGANAINNPVRDQDLDGRFKTWNLNAAGFRLSVGRLITNKVTFESVFSLNSIEENTPISEELQGVEYPYISLDGMFKYQFTKGLGLLDPYATLGGGYTWLDTIGAGTVAGGVGVNIWVGDRFGFNIQSVYKHAFKEYGLQHYQHSAGIVFRFGGKDTDGDGINDDVDACPDLFGIIEANGCPDADGDSVIDSEDLCPNDFGPTTMRGCPDNDGDGTPDKYDKCPTVKGAINDDGCPRIDTDGDGIDDRFDKCPKQPGVKENQGCPKVLTPQEKQQLANLERQKNLDRNAKIKQQVTNDINNYCKAIVFNYGKTSLSPEGKKALDEIYKIMNLQKNMKFHVTGHTDNVGSKATNLALSEKRAASVKNYLITKGISNSRVTSQGYGEENPIADNSTNEGRIKNRRIEIYITN